MATFKVFQPQRNLNDMASILYFSVHEILEYDEMNILYELGHTVFSLGTFCPALGGSGGWRPKPNIKEDKIDSLVDEFIKTGCKVGANFEINPEFFDLFDAIIVMHDIKFILDNWGVLKGKKVIWRSVGQGADEKVLGPLRDEGLLIVGWSEREAFKPEFIGRDAVIYAYKDANAYGPWTGRDGGIITFSNAYKQRYPHELEFFERSVRGLPYKVGGAMNDDVRNAIGLVEFAEQKKMYSGCGVYFYAHGSYVPYTLNFIEAFITGAPVVAIGLGADLPGYDLSYNEVIHIIKHGENGFIVNSPAEAQSVLKEILENSTLATRIGNAGRDTAAEKFGKAKALAAWKNLLDQIGLN